MYHLFGPRQPAVWAARLQGLQEISPKDPHRIHSRWKKTYLVLHIVLPLTDFISMAAVQAIILLVVCS